MVTKFLEQRFIGCAPQRDVDVWLVFVFVVLMVFVIKNDIERPW